MIDKICPTCNNKLSYGWYHSSREYRYSCCTCNYQEVDGKEIDKDFKQYSELFLEGMPEPHIYDTKIDDAAKTASLQADDCLVMIGIVPPLGSEVLCSSEQETENYNRINFELVGKISALESMLASAKNELSEANETIAKLKTALSRYECRVKGV